MIRRLLALAAVLLVSLGVLYAVIGWPLGGGSASPAKQTTVVLDATSTPAPSAPTETVAPQPVEDDGCAPPSDPSFLSANQIVAYYGNPYAQQLGILGQHSPSDLVSMLRDEAAKLDALNGFRGVQPAFDIIYETAQSYPGNDGLYLQYVDDATMKDYTDIACENHFLIFLDLQIGRSDVPVEVNKVLPYLRASNVHIALDPEFTMGEGEVPGQTIGHLDASQINAAQQILEDLVVQDGLPDKILIVHEFDAPMITNLDQIQSFQHVKLVIDMDGFGPKETKIKKFGWYAQPAQHSGIKIFFHQDAPVMTEEEVEALNPDVIIYQ
jgi:hypothetical protein